MAKKMSREELENKLRTSLIEERRWREGVRAMVEAIIKTKISPEKERELGWKIVPHEWYFDPECNPTWVCSHPVKFLKYQYLGGDSDETFYCHESGDSGCMDWAPTSQTPPPELVAIAEEIEKYVMPLKGAFGIDYYEFQKKIRAQIDALSENNK
jgi:hypothetical protein